MNGALKDEDGDEEKDEEVEFLHTLTIPHPGATSSHASAGQDSTNRQAG